MITPKATGERIKKYLAEGKRFDGRKPEEFRNISIEKEISEHAEGSARVRIGNTEVLVGVKLGIGEPYPDSPNQGNLMTTAELLPLSSDRFELGPPKFDSIEIGRIIDRALRESKFIEFEKLCIKEGEKVWTLFVDIYSINDDGNLLDAAGVGALVALKTATMPKYDEETGKIDYKEKTKTSLPLSKDFPISITAYKIGKNFLVDPTKEEEDVAEARVTMGIHDGKISSMQKGDREKFTIEEFNNVLELVERVWKDLNKKLDKELK